MACIYLALIGRGIPLPEWKSQVTTVKPSHWSTYDMYQSTVSKPGLTIEMKMILLMLKKMIQMILLHVMTKLTKLFCVLAVPFSVRD